MSISSTLGDAVQQLLGSGATATPAPAGALFPALYVFGDSLSDVGNDFTASVGQLPVSPPYDDGRFSNGPIWAEDLGARLGTGTVKPSLGGGDDYAYGGAQTGDVPGHAATPIDLNFQLTQFQTQTPHPASDALYATWIGANDVMNMLDSGADIGAAITAAVNNEMSFLSDLVDGGAANLLVLNVPDLGKTPDSIAAGAGYANAASVASLYYDWILQTQLTQFAAAHPVQLTVVDTYSLLDSVIADPAASGFSNVSTPVWSGGLTDAGSGALQTPDAAAQAGYLFWDGLHPTTATHAVIANAVANQLVGPA